MESLEHASAIGASPDRIDGSDDADGRVIVVCDQGYSSGLAPHTLRRLGLAGVTDLDGGYQAPVSETRGEGASP